MLSLAIGGIAEVVADGVTGRLWPETPQTAALIADEVIALGPDGHLYLMQIDRDGVRIYRR